VSKWLVVAGVLAVLQPSPALAQSARQPERTLQACLAEETSGKDRTDLAVWVFLAMSSHPSMKQFAADGAADAMTDSSRRIGTLVTRLLAESCVKETRAAITGGGAQSLQLAFEGLGQLAMQELMIDKSVRDSMAAFQEYVDQRRLMEAFIAK
jgi:hypothetical protein